MEQLADCESGSQRETQPDFIELETAMKILGKKWQATEEELAAWIFLGPEQGGIAAYFNKEIAGDSRRFSFSYNHCHEKYLDLLDQCVFIAGEIEKFKPTKRYITGNSLVKRWGHLPRPTNKIHNMIKASLLMPFHPTFGYPQGVFEENAGDVPRPPLDEGLFLLEDVEHIENKYSFITHDKSETLAHSLKGKTIPQHQKFRGLCIDELRKFARRWVEDFPDVPIQGIALYEYHSRWTQHLKRRDQDLRCPLYVVVFEAPGLQWPPTSSGSKNFPPTIEEINTAYPSEKDQHPWKDFLDKVDNIPGQRFKENSYFIYAGFDRVYESAPADTWRQEWLFMAIDNNADNLPEGVDRNGPSIVLLPLEQEEETLTVSPKQPPPTDQAAPADSTDTVKYGWIEMEEITGLSRDQIRYRANVYGYKFAKEDPDDPQSKPGLMIKQLNKIARYKRSNAVT